MTATVLAYIPSPAQGVWHLGPLSALFIVAGIFGAMLVGSWLWDIEGDERTARQNIALRVVPAIVVVIGFALAYVSGSVNRLWFLGPVPIRAYAFCILLGIVAALIIGDRRWVARGGRSGVIYDIALWAVPFGLIGGRLYHVMTDWPKYFGPEGLGFWAAWRIWDGGLGIWGAVALGGIGAWIACRRRGIPLPAFGDAIAPGIVLAQAIGRLGNYFNQELYGRATTLPWGLEIYERRDASGAIDPLNGVATGPPVAVVHPTFLYELLWNVLIFAVLIWVDRRFKIGHGRLFALYVAGYCVGRFWIELMRSDFASHPIDGIRVNTLTSTFVFVGAVVYIMVAPKGREDPASLKGTDEEEDREAGRVDELGEELVAVAATSGVVAAATVAGEEDQHESESSGAGAGVTEAAEAEPEPTEGLGSVEGGEVAEAQEDAPEVHEAAVEGVAEAESVAEDVAAEAEPERAAAEPVPDEPAAADESAAEEGLGSVEGGEVAEAQEDAPEVHEAAVEGVAEAESVAEDVAAEAEPEPADAEPVPDEPAAADESAAEEGLGSVEGGEVAEAQEDAPEVHEAAVEGVAEAESVAEDVAAEAEPEPAAAEPVPDEPAAADESAAEEGLGSVEGGEVAEAQQDAPEVHEAAVEGAAEAESVAEEVAQDAEPEASEPESQATSDDVPAPSLDRAVKVAEPASTGEPRRRWWRRG